MFLPHVHARAKSNLLHPCLSTYPPFDAVLLEKPSQQYRHHQRTNNIKQHCVISVLPSTKASSLFANVCAISRVVINVTGWMARMVCIPALSDTKSYDLQNMCFFPAVFWPRALRLQGLSYENWDTCLLCVYQMRIGESQVQAGLPKRGGERTGARAFQRGSAWWRENASLPSRLWRPHIICKCWWNRCPSRNAAVPLKLWSWPSAAKKPSSH